MSALEKITIPMRDGVSLVCDVYLPSGKGPWPVILFRTPYGRGQVGWAIREMVADGYGVVCQDVRGAFESEGDFTVLENEGADGKETIEWLIEQPWCNGKVGTQGMSYPANAQWMVAIQNPKGLVTAAPMSAGTAFNGREYISRGVLNLDVFLWTAGRGVARAVRQGLKLEHPLLRSIAKGQWHMEALFRLPMGSPQHREKMAEIEAQRQKSSELCKQLMRESFYHTVEVIGEHAPWIHRMIANPTPEADYWQGYDWCGREDRINIPMLHFAGWYDLFIRSAFKDFLAIPKDKPFQKLIVSPLAHGGFLMPCVDQNRLGEQQFPFEPPVETWLMSGEGFSRENLLRFWFDFWMKGEGEDLTRQAPITLFVMGANIWRDEWEWPLARTQWQKLYLDSDGRANTAKGDGRLVLEPPTRSRADEYRYDPADPVPSRGGAVLGTFDLPGSYDQREIEKREDVLVYTLDTLMEDTEVTGPVTVTLWASTSAVDTDFTAKLVDVCEDGRAFHVCDGVTRLRFRQDRPGLVTPGEVQRLEIELAPTSYVFFKGHRIRLEISSSAFPLFDPNPNTGKSLLLDDSNETIIATQKVFHEPERHSYLRLPVIPAGE